MADVTIAQLPQVTNLLGNAVFPVSQSGSTYSATVSQLTNINTLSAEILLVGGGGSGGYWYYGGGGGGGGVVFLQNVLFIKGCSYNIGVGKGGVPYYSRGDYVPQYSSVIARGGRGGVDGTSSSINGAGLSLIAYGGGGGGGDSSNGDTTSCGGRPGGSGGGASLYAWSYTGDGVPGQGFNGGGGSQHPVVSPGGGGGGGGAGAPGGTATSAQGGSGGPGVQISITGSLVYYGAGGGGGAYSTATGGNGGTGGGGNGANYLSFNSGNATGIGAGGGGGSYSENNYNPGTGSNGTVLIAYPGSPKATGGTISTVSRAGYTVHTFTYPGGTFTPNF